MNRIIAGVFTVLALGGCARPTPETASATVQSLIERGRYLTIIGGCHDCHTAGFALSEGKMDEKSALSGDRMGWQGPWGTTYPANLRLYFSHVSETEWLDMARNSKLRPPMPWYEVREMTDEDLRAIYQYVHSLGPAGEPVPAYLGPGIDAPAPKFQLVLPAGPPDAAALAGNKPFGG